MAKVGAKIGLTLKISKDSQFEFIRPEIFIDEIDTEGNVQEQLELAVKALKETWDTTKEQLDELVIAEMPRVDKEMELQVSRKLLGFENALKELKGQIQTLQGLAGSGRVK